MRQLEIGGAINAVPGFEVMDCREGPGVQHVGRWGEDPLPFLDNTFGTVYSAHCIEHIPWWEVKKAVSEAHRVLFPGGIFEVHTVDFEYLVKCYMEKKAGDNWNCHGRNKDMNHVTWVASRCFAYGKDNADPMWHKGLFDEAYMTHLMVCAGFQNIKRCGPPRGPEKHGPINLGMRGVK